MVMTAFTMIMFMVVLMLMIVFVTVCMGMGQISMRMLMRMFMPAATASTMAVFFVGYVLLPTSFFITKLTPKQTGMLFFCHFY